jgi:transcriptional regulator with XRE-family HTH domain
MSTAPVSPLPALLRARMSEMKLPLNEAARRAGMSRAGMYLILSDKSNPNLSTLTAIRNKWPYPGLFSELDAFL